MSDNLDYIVHSDLNASNVTSQNNTLNAIREIAASNKSNTNAVNDLANAIERHKRYYTEKTNEVNAEVADSMQRYDNSNLSVMLFSIMMVALAYLIYITFD